MTSSSSTSNCTFHVRSISFPCRSHPTTLRVEEELNKIKSLEASTTPTPETICNDLFRLEELYKCMDDLLNLSLTQQALSHHQHEKLANEVLDGSVRILDICGYTRDLISQIKENVRDLQSALRRRKGDLNMESSIAKYTSFRSKMKKDAKRLIASLKQMENQVGCSQILDIDNHLWFVIRVLREVSAASVSTLQSLLLFLCVPITKKKPSRWTVVSKLIHKGGACEEEKMQITPKGLESLEAQIEGIENGLESVFRLLVGTRASLLNIISH